jgi:enolase
MTKQSEITEIRAREVLDSRGNPTVEAEVKVASGDIGRASVPSGASTGSREALELRDGDKARYLGKGVKNAVANVNKKIAPALVGMPATDLIQIDQTMRELDATATKSALGANAILGVSMAASRAAALASGQSLHVFLRDLYYKSFLKISESLELKGIMLPTPMMNIINGGAHADNDLSIQEFMIIPVCGGSFRESLRAGVEVFHNLKKVLHDRGHSTNVGDEGGFAPSLKTNEEAFEFILEAIALAGYRPGHDIYLALDAAASEFQTREGHYLISGAPTPQMSSEEMVKYYFDLAGKYPIVSIEDGLHEGDWAGWKKLTQSQGRQTMLVGDDLFVTNAEILRRGIGEQVANAILIKLNQIGSVTETLETIALARTHRYNTVISHRSGETEDAFLADLAVAVDAGLVKTGSASRGERMAKYNQLLRIEEELGSRARFGGLQSLGKKL